MLGAGSGSSRSSNSSSSSSSRDRSSPWVLGTGAHLGFWKVGK